MGFHFSTSPTLHAHIEALSKRIRRKFWVLYHLRRAGFTEKDLAKVYRTCLLPILEYCSVVFHPMMKDEQDQAVERLQSAALRCIYGYSTSYARMRELAEVQTLRHRRIEASDKFAKNCLGHSRFSAWFPAKAVGRRSMRKGDEYLEEFARCNRLKNTPLFYMRRRLNGKEGKSYGSRNAKYRNETTDEERTAGIRGRKNPRPHK